MAGGAIPPQASFQESENPAFLERILMSLISLVITLIVVGVLLWLVNTYIPMDGKIKKILNIVVVICVVIWLLVAFGVLDRSTSIQVPQVR
jgi:cation transporter-like permease